MPTKEQIEAALRNADAAGDVKAAKALAKALKSGEYGQPKEEKAKPIGSVIDPIMQGLTLGYADELGAAGARLGASLAGAPTSRVEAAGQRQLEESRGRLSDYRERHPVMSFANEMAGTAPWAVMAGGLSQLGTPAMVSGAAAEGAVAGYGAAEENKGLGALLGGVAGGVVAGAAPMAGEAVRRGYQSGKNALAPIYRKFTEGPQSTAARVLSESLEAGGVRPAELASRARQLGPNATLADAAGPAGVVTGQGVIKADPTGASAIKARKLFEQRARGAGGRVAEGVKRATGVKSRLQDTLDAVIERQKANAVDAYKGAYNIPVDPADDTLISILNRPAVRKAFPAALENAANEGRKVPSLEKIVMQGDDWKVGREAFPDMQALDEIKRTLDKQVNAAYRTDPAKATAMRAARDALRSHLDTINPAYKQARDLYSGDAALIESMESGEKFLNMKTRDVTKAIKEMTESEKEAFLQGAVESIRERMGRAREGEMGLFRFLETGNAKEKLRALFPAGREGNRQMAQLMRDLNRERTFATTQGQITGGSQTAMREAAGNVIEQKVGIPTATEAITSPGRALMGGAMRKAQQSLSGLNQKSIDELSDLMFTPGNIDVVLAELRRRGVPKEVISQFLKRATQAGSAVAPAAGLGAGELAQ